MTKVFIGGSRHITRELKRKRYLDQAMAEKRKSNPRFAVCVRNEGYEASLERNKLYVVLPDADADREGDIRVLGRRRRSARPPGRVSLRQRPPLRQVLHVAIGRLYGRS